MVGVFGPNDGCVFGDSAPVSFAVKRHGSTPCTRKALGDEFTDHPTTSFWRYPMSRSAMLIAAGATCMLILGACAEDAPTANPVTQERSVVKAPTASPDIVIGSTVFACVNNSSGTIKITPAGAACAGNELALTLATGSGGGSAIAGHEVVSAVQFIAPGTAITLSATCPVGKKVQGGGYSLHSSELQVTSSFPGNGSGNVIDNGWAVIVRNTDFRDRQAAVYATCANAE